jgi:hypothetical protein
VINTEINGDYFVQLHCVPLGRGKTTFLLLMISGAFSDEKRNFYIHGFPVRNDSGLSGIMSNWQCPAGRRDQTISE